MWIEPAGKPAGFSGNPTLQAGGVQDALMAAAPGWGVMTVQGAPGGHPEVAEPAASAAGDEEIQVSGALGTIQPCTSTAVAVMVSDVPLLTTKLVSVLLCEPVAPSSSAMHCTGQASKVEAVEDSLEAPEAEAIIWVCPGVAPGDTVTWLVCTL